MQNQDCLFIYVLHVSVIRLLPGLHLFELIDHGFYILSFVFIVAISYAKSLGYRDVKKTKAGYQGMLRGKHNLKAHTHIHNFSHTKTNTHIETYIELVTKQFLFTKINYMTLAGLVIW